MLDRSLFILMRRLLKTKIIKIIVISSVVLYGMHAMFHDRHQKVLRVLTWADTLPAEIFQRFEEKYNVRLVLDYFDSQEVIEVKLNSGFAGYDVITPTAVPFSARYIKKNLLRPIDTKRLKNYKNIMPIFIEKLKPVDPTSNHIIPFSYGTIGILYNKTMIDRLKLPSYPTHYGYLFDPKIVCQWGKYGIGLLAEFGEVFEPALRYLKYDPHTSNEKELYAAYKTLANIRPYIRRFSSNRYINDLLVEELIYAEALSDEAKRGMIDAREHNIELVFVRPPNEKGMYIDCFAIPTTAKSVELAEQFIDFCLEEKNAIAITEYSCMPNVVSHRFKDQLDPEYFLDVDIEELTVAPIRSPELSRKLLYYWRHFLQKLPI